MEENKEINEELNEKEVTTQDSETSSMDEKVENNVTNEPSAEEQLSAEKDRYIRLYAEFENYKKRTNKERLEYFQYASQEMMTSMLDVLDDFERALKDLRQSDNEEHLKGVELIYQKLRSRLVDKGLKPIEVNSGDTFNVDLHEAITQIPAPSDDLKGRIVDVIETGYQLHDKVIRFAKVVTGS